MPEQIAAASERDGGPAAGASPPPPAAPAAAAAFAAGVSTAATLAGAVQQACDQALSGLRGTAPSFAVLFTYKLGTGEASDAELLAARLPPGCAIVGCQGHGIIGIAGPANPGSLVDSSTQDLPPEPQQGVSLLLGALPGRHIAAFAAAAPPPGPGARHKVGQPITIADAAADREALRTWLALPAGAEPASILLFCADDEPSLFALPHPHGLLARLQRVWPDVVVQGGVSAGELHYRPGSSTAGNAPAASAALNYCGLMVCKAADGGAAAPPFVSAALTLKTAEGRDAVFTDVRLVEESGDTFALHPFLGPQPVWVVRSLSADPQQLARLFKNEEQPGGPLPVDSALIHYLLEHPEGGEMAFWAADRSTPGDYDSRVRAGHPVFVVNMAMQQEQDVFFVYGSVLPLDLPAVRAILAEAQTGHGKMLCAQWVRVQGAGAGREVLEAELPTLLSHCPPAAPASAGGPSHQALLVFKDTDRGMPQRHWPIEREMGTVHRLAPQVPLVGVYCPGIIGPNTPSHFCGLRCLSDSGEAGGAPTSSGVAGRLAALGLGQQQLDEQQQAERQRQRQQQRFGVIRSETLSYSVTLSLLGSA